MNLAHTQPEVVETLSDIERWITVVAFVGGFALLLCVADLGLSAGERLADRIYERIRRVDAGPVLSLFDVDLETGKIDPVEWEFDPFGNLVEVSEVRIPDVGADGLPRTLSPPEYRRTLQHKPPRVETSASGWEVHEFEPDGPEDSYPLCRRCRGGRFNEIHRVPKLSEVDDSRR